VIQKARENRKNRKKITTPRYNFRGRRGTPQYCWQKWGGKHHPKNTIVRITGEKPAHGKSQNKGTYLELKKEGPDKGAINRMLREKGREMQTTEGEGHGNA